MHNIQNLRILAFLLSFSSKFKANLKMGGKGSKGKDASGKPSKVPPKAATNLNDKDLKFLMDKTGMTKDQVNALFAKFNQDNPDGKLDRAEFMKLYPTLRYEPIQNLDEITNMVFRGLLYLFIFFYC